MATKTTLIDDLTGEDGATTRTFSAGGPEFEIDLTDGNWTTLSGLLDDLGRFVEVAQRVKPRSAYSALSPSAKQEIRKALKKSGRTRVSDAEVAAWQAGHPSIDNQNIRPVGEPDTLPEDDLVSTTDTKGA